MKTTLRWIVAVTALLLAIAANAREWGCRLTEIFVPQTSEFAQHYPSAGIGSFDLSPNGRTLAVEFGTQEPDKTFAVWVGLWDVRSQRLTLAKQVERNLPTILSGHSPGMPALPMPILWYHGDIRFSPDGHMLLVLTGPRLVALSFPALKFLYSIDDRVLAPDVMTKMFIAAFSAAANRLAVLEEISHNSTQCCSLKVMIASLKTGTMLAEWDKPGHSRSVALSPDGNFVALTVSPRAWGYRNVPAGENDVFVVRADSGEVVRALNTGYAAGDAEFLPGGSELVTIPIDHWQVLNYPRDAIKVWKLKTGQLERTFSYPKYGVRGNMAISANGKWMAVTNVWLNTSDIRHDRDNPRGYARLLLWNLPSGSLVYDSGNLNEEYNRVGAPMDTLIGIGRPAVLVRLSASGDGLAVGGEIISVRSVEAGPHEAMNRAGGKDAPGNPLPVGF